VVDWGGGLSGVAMATMRSGVVAPTFAEGAMVNPSPMGVREARIGRSSVWGTTRGLGSMKLVERVVKSRAPRADMSGSDGLPAMPPSHRIKAASVSAFQEFQNARANRKFPSTPR
jgi:hypothetical protein